MHHPTETYQNHLTRKLFLAEHGDKRRTRDSNKQTGLKQSNSEQERGKMFSKQDKRYKELSLATGFPVRSLEDFAVKGLLPQSAETKEPDGFGLLRNILEVAKNG